MDQPFNSFDNVLSSFYDLDTQFSSSQFWKSVLQAHQLSDDHLLPTFYTSQSFLFKVFKFFLSLPYKPNIRKILRVASQYIDPSPKFLKSIIQQLVPFLENRIPCLSTINCCLAIYNSIFQQQNPTNQNLDSHISLFGAEEGIVVSSQVKWPFEKGGTIAIWYNMSEKTKQCKIFQFLTQQKVGFQIIMKNRKIYIQKQEQQIKFRLIKNTSSYLCDAIFNKNVKLYLQFEIKKKFFQPFMSVKLIMNNFALNGIQIDSFSINNNPFHIKFLKGFHGKFYSAMILKEKLLGQLDQLSKEKGFPYQNDIRNFICLFEKSAEKVLLLFSAVRSKTITEQVRQQKQNEIVDQLRQVQTFAPCRPIRTELYDSINSYVGVINNQKGYSYTNISITKQMGYYGGFESLVPFLSLLQICCCNQQLYISALNQYLQLVKSVFQNKADSIQKACQISFFNLLSQFFNRTKMIGFRYETITNLKQIYISLNTRSLREKFIEEVVWGINFGLYLDEENFINYIKFIKTFYNEDIQRSLHIFDISKIFTYILENLDRPNCCFDHSKGSAIQVIQAPQYSQITNSVESSKLFLINYQKIVLTILEIVENIMLMKQCQEGMQQIVRNLFQIFRLTMSPCLVEALIVFIQNMFVKDEFIQKKFIQYINRQELQARLSVYKCLSCCNSWRTKGKIIQFILQILQPNFFDQTKKQKEMLALCTRYPTINFIRTSSINSKSNENRDSIDYSQDKLSLNSATMHKFFIINPIQYHDVTLFDNFQVIQVILNWAFSEQVISFTGEDHENPGLLILMELYKGSSYQIRVQIAQIIHQKVKVIRFSPELMAWAIQCALIAEFDWCQSLEKQKNIEKTKNEFIELICYYNFITNEEEEEENNQLSIIKLIFSSVKSKYPEEIIKVAGNKLFFIICEKKMQIFVHELKIHNHQDILHYDKLCARVVSNLFTFMAQYFIIKGDGDFIDFDEDMAEIIESENNLILEIMEKILQILVLLANINDRKIIQEANAERNHFAITLLFPEKDKDKERVNIMYQIFGALHNIFDLFEDLDIEPKKKSMLLIKKYLIYLIQLTQNSGSAKLQGVEDDLKNIFLVNLSFLEQKFYQYFYYPFDRHKNIDFQLETKIRKSIEQIKKTIFNIFLDLIELIQYIDQKGDMEHKSFYELMKPKRKPVHRYSLKHFYPNFWKQADQKIKQFLCLKKDILRRDAQEKLQTHILGKKVSIVAASIEKVNAKKIFNFVETERKNSENRQKKSVNFYKITESEKCRNFIQCEQLLLEYRIKVLDEQKTCINKIKEKRTILRREVKNIWKKLWNTNRTFEGLWINKSFYGFSQSSPMKSNNELSKYYERSRLNRHSKFFLLPFIQIQAIPTYSQNENQKIEDEQFINDNFVENVISNKMQPKRSTSEKLITGLQFIKKKVYSKLLKSISAKEEQSQVKSNQEKDLGIWIENVLWIKPMKIHMGNLKIELSKIKFVHRNSKQFQHISLFKNSPLENEKLIEQWEISYIQGLILRRFLLKLSSLQIFFKNRTSIFLSFYATSNQQFCKAFGKISELYKNMNPSPQFPLLSSANTVGDPIKFWQAMQFTEKWLNYQLSNFEYLMCLNIASGRTYCDLNQYPVMPWIFSQYNQTKFKKNEEKFRDFNKNVAQLGKQQRIKKFQDLYQSIATNHNEQFPVPHYFGFHYSNFAIVLQYLIRLNPYSCGSRQLQGGKFDITDRLFHSIPQNFKSVTNQMSDLRQLIPQFFYFPQFLINSEGFQFGKLQQDSKQVNHVQLPDGCLNAYDFIEHHRLGLQSKEVSANIHKWIDLIFGYKSSGKEAQKYMNLYHYLSNQVNCDRIDSVEDLQQKEALQSQMAYYGKTPSQIFTKPHPQRQPRSCIQFENWDKSSFTLVDNFGSFFEKNGFCVDDIIHFSYIQRTKSYCLIEKTGRGIYFSLEKKHISKITEFVINYFKIQGINLIDLRTSIKAPIELIEDKVILVGGIWGGKLLSINLTNSRSELLSKHADTISYLKFSHFYNILFSGSINGQLCKWQFSQLRLFFKLKVYCFSQINQIQINQDLRTVSACTEEGALFIMDLENLTTLRVIKVEYPIISFLGIKYPFYGILINCRSSHQYSFSLNGCLIQQCQMEMSDNLALLTTNCCRQQIVGRVGEQLVFIKMPDLQIQQKLEIGIGGSGFIFSVNKFEIAALNSSQLLVWRKPIEQLDIKLA